jgi:hypothetical protein
MSTGNDPKIVSLVQRTALLGEQIQRQQEELAALRRDLTPGVWILDRMDGGLEVTWRFRPRKSLPPLRSA